MSVLFIACANIVPPSGGEMDKTPPKLISMTPKDSLLNQRVTKIVLRFDKFVEVNNLAQNLTLSPLLEYPPTVIANKKRVEITIVDSLLKDNTTYKISLGKAITDNREKTPYENFTYTFSTGDFFDSMQLKGQVVDMITGKQDTGITMLLYAADNFNDSVIVRKKPLYITKTDMSGYFKFTGLPNKTFKIFALKDLDANNVYNPDEESIGFLDDTLTSKLATDSTQSILIYTSKMSKRVSTRDSLERDSLNRLAQKYVGRVVSKAKNALAYSVMVDTASKDKGTFELNAPLQIKLNAVLGKIDSNKVFLSYLNSGVEAEAQSSLSHDTGSLYINSHWTPETHYTLRLVKGWAIDTAGAELPPGRYTFMTKRVEDYASLQVKFDGKMYVDSHHVAVIIQDKDTLYNKLLTDSIIQLKLLKPGNCQIFLFKDINKNGKWDPGNVFIKRQPEPVFRHEADVMLKAGWEHEVDFKYNLNSRGARGAAEATSERKGARHRD